MGSTPTPPIITDEHGDITFYRSMEAARADLEAVDVANNEYTIVDSTGLAIAATVSEGQVVLSVDRDQAADPDALATRLRHFVERVGADRIGLDEPVQAASLSELVGALARFFGVPAPG